MLFKRLFMGAAVVYGLSCAPLVRADEFTPAGTLFLDTEPLAHKAMLFKVKDRLVVVNELEWTPASSITVYSEQGQVLAKQNYNFNLANSPYMGDDHAVYLSGTDGKFVRYGITDTVHWEKLISPQVDPLYSSFYLVNDTVYVTLPLSRQVMALSKTDGGVKWITTLPFAGWDYDIKVTGNDLRVISNYGESRIYFYTLNKTTGDIRFFNFYTSAIDILSRIRSILRTKTQILISVADVNWQSRILKLDLDGKLIGEVPTTSICTNGEPSFVNTLNRFYAVCSDFRDISSRFVELNDDGKILRDLGAVNTLMSRRHFDFGKKVIFWGGHYSQDAGFAQFVFLDGSSLSPIRSALSNHSDERIQNFAFDKESEHSELALLSYDSKKDRKYIKLFDAK